MNQVISLFKLFGILVAGLTLRDLANLATAAAVCFLAWQVRGQRRDRRHDEIAKVFEEIAAPEFRHEVRVLCSRTPEEIAALGIDDPDKDTIEAVSTRLDRLAWKVRIRLIPRKKAIDRTRGTIVRCAQQLLPYIRKEQEQRHPERYRKDFVWFARKCKHSLLREYWLAPRYQKQLGKLEQLLRDRPLGVFSTRPQASGGEEKSNDAEPP